MSEQKAESSHTCLTGAGSPVCPGCKAERYEIFERGAEIAQRADMDREQMERSSMSERQTEIDVLHEAAGVIAAWSSPSGWIAQQAVVAFLEDGSSPQAWELHGPAWVVTPTIPPCGHCGAATSCGKQDCDRARALRCPPAGGESDG